MWDESWLSPGSTWRHVKTNSTYTVLCVAECSTNGRELERSVVYVSHDYQGFRYREIKEFLDGRFRPVTRQEAP